MKRALVIAALALAGCSSKPLAVGVKYDAPAGFELLDDAPERATFSHGLFIARAKESDATSAANGALGAGWTSLSNRDGTLPIGVVARLELQHGDQMALIYFAPTAHLVIGLTADSAQFGTLEAKVEQSLARLQLAR